MTSLCSIAGKTMLATAFDQVVLSCFLRRISGPITSLKKRGCLAFASLEMCSWMSVWSWMLGTGTGPNTPTALCNKSDCNADAQYVEREVLADAPAP